MCRESILKRYVSSLTGVEACGEAYQFYPNHIQNEHNNCLTLPPRGLRQGGASHH